MHSPDNISPIEYKIDYNDLPKPSMQSNVQDFLQFEDSDDDDYGVIFQKHMPKPKEEL